MTESGRRGTFTFVAVFFPLTFAVAMAVLTGGDVIAEDNGGPTHLPLGDWNVTGSRSVEGEHLVVTGDINVLQGATLTIIDSFIQVNSSLPHQFTMRMAAGSTLTVVNSTLDLDNLESDAHSGIDLSGGTVVNTRGSCLIRSNSLHAYDVDFNNMAPDGYVGGAGEDAVMVLDGSVSSEFQSVIVKNMGGRAGLTSPGSDGIGGGSSLLWSNVSVWTSCEIVCEAGTAAGGGLGLSGHSGGDGGPGGDAKVMLIASQMDFVHIYVRGSDGGIGARGSHNPAGDGGNGGDGGQGGSALLHLDGDTLVLKDCMMLAVSGDGGSGGNGGSAIDGDGGTAGQGSDGGDAIISITSGDVMRLDAVRLITTAGDGGYGGDYGRHESGTGSFGIPMPGGDGGDGRVEVLGGTTLRASDLNVTVNGGSGLDGGGGYEQGGTGGKAGGGTIIVHFNQTINATDIYLDAHGGNGGPGGPAFSEIRGNGGDGGDALVQFDADEGTYIRYFEIRSEPGDGGMGHKPIYDGTNGIGLMDIDTLMLEAWEGTFTHPLDDLHGEAEGHLYNVNFDTVFGIHALPMASAEIWEYFSVDIEYINDPTSMVTGPLVNWTVVVISEGTDAVLKSKRTDLEGKVRFWILSMHYTSLQVNYHGSIRVIATSPSKLVSDAVRLEVQAPIRLVRSINVFEPTLAIHIHEPVSGRTYTFNESEPGPEVNLLVCQGVVQRTDQGTLREMVISLYEGSLGGRRLAVWELQYGSPGNMFEPYLYRPDPEVSEWTFYLGVDVFNESQDLDNGSYMFKVDVTDGNVHYIETVGFRIELVGFNSPPHLLVTTHINDTVWSGEPMIVIGEAWDDAGVMRVEYNLDDTGWQLADGREEWEFVVNTSLLENGNHTLSIRAMDIYLPSEVLTYTFVVDVPEPHDNGGGGPEDQWDMETYLFVLILIVVIVLALATAAVLARRRSSPDS